ncbi:hypothetical protein HK097_000170 [Rhizophlyctis rosea]|uniref:Uncharacterized protein n=1 Tax=Rhizophlyctis rosea TaxID=64517 RepID=A0AAD5X1N1_9FUNG|nr:hypothetical protein HK097_000170 [Rhizophlyctis rosea]
MAKSIFRYLLFQFVLSLYFLDHPLPDSVFQPFNSALNLLPHLHQTAAPRIRYRRSPLNIDHETLVRRQVAADPAAPADPASTIAPAPTTTVPPIVPAVTTVPPVATTTAPAAPTVPPVATAPGATATTRPTVPTTTTSRTTTTTTSQTSRRSSSTAAAPSSEWVMATETAYTYLPQASPRSSAVGVYGATGWKHWGPIVLAVVLKIMFL